MVLKTTSGMQVSMVSTDKKSLFDKHGNEWIRYASGDNSDSKLICYMNPNNSDRVLLNMAEIKRVMAGPAAMQHPTNLDEMRDFIEGSPKYIQDVANSWPDQKLREILIESEERGVSPAAVLEKAVDHDIEAARPKEEPKEGHPGATETHRTLRTGRNTPRSRKQEGSVSVALEEVSVLLTPKQLEFMERLSECPDWDSQGPSGSYIASEYAQELSDTMNPMSVGAVLTTLREKGLLTTEKCKIGAIKSCVFRLTDLGMQVYNKLSDRKG